jgi:hypothetical protein
MVGQRTNLQRSNTIRLQDTGVTTKEGQGRDKLRTSFFYPPLITDRFPHELIGIMLCSIKDVQFPVYCKKKLWRTNYYIKESGANIVVCEKHHREDMLQVNRDYLCDSLARLEGRRIRW